MRLMPPCAGWPRCNSAEWWGPLRPRLRPQASSAERLPSWLFTALTKAHPTQSHKIRLHRSRGGERTQEVGPRGVHERWAAGSAQTFGEEDAVPFTRED